MELKLNFENFQSFRYNDISNLIVNFDDHNIYEGRYNNLSNIKLVEKNKESRLEAAKRTIEQGRIYEISVVTDAAYPATHSQLRSVMSEINQKRRELLRRRTK
jgi:phage head maturation protease